VIIAIIIPTYNEAVNIGRLIDQLCQKYFPRIVHVDLRIIVVDDNSPDGTGDIVRGKIKQFPIVYLLPSERKGLGAAYVRGMKFAMNNLNADAVIEMDADFQHHPKYVEEFVSAFLNGADYVIGSRFVPGGSIPSDWVWYRKVISRIGNRFSTKVLNLDHVHDLTTGFRLTRVKGVLDKIDLNNLIALKWFAFKVDLSYQTIHLSGHTVELPIDFLGRSNEKSKFKLLEIIFTFKVVVTLRIRKSLKKLFE
jgi:dolichol-phosphate mannosyltransferase